MIKNNTIFSKAIIPINQLIDKFGVDICASDMVWCIILGALPYHEGKLENMVLEMSLKDSTEHKVENINQLTELAKLFTKRKDYSESNLYQFSCAIKQLFKYVSGDQSVTLALTEMKNIYLSFITSYYRESMSIGQKEEALEVIKFFREDIFQEYEKMKEDLAKITY